MSTAEAAADLPVAPAAWRAALGNRLVAAGLAVIAFFLFIAAFADGLAPSAPDQQLEDGLDADGMPRAPCRQFPLGSDNLGRDVLSRVLHGTRISLTVGAVAMLTALVIGVLVGLYAGYYGGWVDGLLMRLTDVVLALPALLLALALAGLMDGKVLLSRPVEIRLERGLLSVCLVIGVVSWTGIARVVRAQVLSLKERAFVEAARAVGCSDRRIVWRHILPNVLPALIVLATMSVAGTILFEAGLGYLGWGVPKPAPSWGNMISDGQPYLLVAPWLVIPPGVAIVLAVLGFNLLGQGLQDVLDPYHKKRA
ncbi:MAG TPA: ABC transporter permease [Gemmataceae bacterium]|nr:ABC transporter permease [Gemmataceae bacterium]